VSSYSPAVGYPCGSDSLPPLLRDGLRLLLALLANFTKFQHSGQTHNPKIFINPLYKKMKNK